MHIIENEKQELTENENLALRAFQKTRCEHAPTWVLGGILGGLITSVVINLQAGLFLTIATSGVAFTNTINQGNKRLKLLQGDAPITSVMDAELLADYRYLVGEEEYDSQLNSLADSSIELAPAVKKEVHHQQLIKDSKSVLPDEELALCASQCALILGCPGAGKDFLVSNALRKAKTENTDLKIYLIDPKGLQFERSYYEDFVDVFDARQCANMSDADIVLWAKEHIEKFQERSSNTDEQWLFIITEATLTGGAFDRLKDAFLAGFIAKFTVTANGFGNALWLLAQYPNLKDLGITNNGRSQLQTFAIVNTSTVTKVRQWVRSGVLPKAKEEDLRILCRQSEVDRAFYSPVAGKWAVMPRLTNYSSYDRDSRTLVKSKAKPKDNHKASLDYSQIFDALVNAQTNDLATALQQLEKIPEGKLEELVAKLKDHAVRLERADFLQKFKL